MTEQQEDQQEQKPASELEAAILLTHQLFNGRRFQVTIEVNESKQFAILSVVKVVDPIDDETPENSITH